MTALLNVSGGRGITAAVFSRLLWLFWKGQRVNILPYLPSDPTATDCKAAFDTAAATAPNGGYIEIEVPDGTYKMDTLFTGNGRKVFLHLGPNVTWTGTASALPFFVFKNEKLDITQGGRRRTQVQSVSSVSQVVGEEIIHVESGTKGTEPYRLTYTYNGPGEASGGFQQVVHTVIARWDTPANPSTNTAVLWRVGLFAKSAGQSAIAEYNPCSRFGDPGWQENFAGTNNHGGIHVIPEADVFSGGTNFGYNTQYGYAAHKSEHLNNLGKFPKTYNAFIAYRDSLAPGGVAFYAGGDTTGVALDYPFGPVRMGGTFLHGIYTANATFSSGMALEMGAGQSIGWVDGSGNPEVRWFKGSGSPEGVVAAPIGSLYSRTNGGAGTSFYVKESGTGNTGWVAK